MFLHLPKYIKLLPKYIKLPREHFDGYPVFVKLVPESIKGQSTPQLVSDTGFVFFPSTGTDNSEIWKLAKLGIKYLLTPCFPSLLLLFSHVQLFATPWTAAHQASLSFTISWSLLKLMSIESVMPSNHLILCHPLLLPPSIFPSIRVFFNEPVLCIRCPKYWSFSFSISPSNECSGLVSFRMDWLDHLAV